MTLLLRDTQHHTYGEYLTWSDDRREELIDGIAYIKEPPTPPPLHQEVLGEMLYQISTALRGKASRVYVGPLDVRLPKADETDDAIDTVVQPDLLIVCNRHRLDERGLRGAPDWLAEVLSPSTANHDQIRKVPVYERAGVPEVWLIHPTDMTLTLYRLESRCYGRPMILELKGQTRITSVPDVIVDWDRLISNLVYSIECYS